MNYKKMLLSLAEMNKRDDIKSNRSYWTDVYTNLTSIKEDDTKALSEIANISFGLELSEIEEEYNYRKG